MKRNRTPDVAEHLDGGQDFITPQITVDHIAANYDDPSDYGVADKSEEVLAIANDRFNLHAVITEVMRGMNAERTPVQRIVLQSAEMVTRSIYCAANAPTKLVAANYNRSRLIISGAAVNCLMGQDQNIAFDGTTPIGDAIAIGFAANTAGFTREVRSKGEIWVLCLTAAVIGIQEEFYAGPVTDLR